MPPKEGRGYFRLRKSVSVPGIKGKRGRTFKPGEEEALQDYVNEYNEAAGETDGAVAPIDLEEALARPGTVALPDDATQDELDDNLSAMRNLTLAAPERSVRWTQRVEKPEGEAADDDEDGPPSRGAKRGKRSTRAKK